MVDRKGCILIIVYVYTAYAIVWLLVFCASCSPWEWQNVQKLPVSLLIRAEHEHVSLSGGLHRFCSLCVQVIFLHVNTTYCPC